MMARRLSVGEVSCIRAWMLAIVPFSFMIMKQLGGLALHDLQRKASSIVGNHSRLNVFPHLAGQ